MRHLTAIQIKAVNKIGDLMLPGVGAMPSFSKTGCVQDIDRLLDYVPSGDLADLKVLLLLLGLMPRSFVAALLWVLERSIFSSFPGAGLMRTIRLGLRGIIMSLYYGHPIIHERMQFQVGVYLDDRR